LNERQDEVIELEDFGDVATQTRTFYWSPEYPDRFLRGPFSRWLEGPTDRPEDMSSK